MYNVFVTFFYLQKIFLLYFWAVGSTQNINNKHFTHTKVYNFSVFFFFFYYTLIVVVKHREFDQENGRFIVFINYVRPKPYDVCIFNRQQRFQISFPFRFIKTSSNKMNASDAPVCLQSSLEPGLNIYSSHRRKHVCVYVHGYKNREYFVEFISYQTLTWQFESSTTYFNEEKSREQKCFYRVIFLPRTIIMGFVYFFPFFSVQNDRNNSLLRETISIVLNSNNKNLVLTHFLTYHFLIICM